MVLPMNCSEIVLFREFCEDPLKVPPAYSYLAPREAILFVVTWQTREEGYHLGGCNGMLCHSFGGTVIFISL